MTECSKCGGAGAQIVCTDITSEHGSIEQWPCDRCEGTGRATMMLLLDVREHSNFADDQVEWAAVSLSIENIDRYLGRIKIVQEIYKAEGSDFFQVRYWSGLPVWMGHCEIWEELYPEPVQIVECLHTQDEFVDTECTFLVVTHEGVCWESTLKNSPGTIWTEVVTVAMLEKLKALQLLEDRRCLCYQEEAGDNVKV